MRLGMDLGLALEKFDADPDAARGLVGEAHGEAQRAIVELRDLVRGLHPAVLEDRGLDAALSALAARSPVPVTLGGRRAGATTGIGRGQRLLHRRRGADECRATRRGPDGFGRRAHRRRAAADRGRRRRPRRRRRAHGTGLAGLADRAAAVDGTFSVVSPTGGGTTLLVELPCAS